MLNMKTMIRCLVITVLLGCASTLFGAYALVTSGNYMQISVDGPSDCVIRVYNADTNALVADFTIYTGSASAYNGGWSYVGGVSASVDATNGYLSGLNGNYRVETEEPSMWNWGSSSSGGGGSGATIYDYQYTYPYDWMTFSIYCSS